MPRLTREELVDALTRHGLRFRAVTVETEGAYQIDDADWNVKDVPHLNQVHGWAQNVNGVTDADVEASINLQRVLVFRLPLVLSHYVTAPDRQTYFFTLLSYVVVCDITFVAVSPTRTRVVTTYTVGSSRFWMLFFPVIGWLLKRNFRQLMSEDLPMRERRGLLRSWGYSFRGDGAPRDFRDSLDISRDNVVAPAQPRPSQSHLIPVDQIPEGGWCYLGRSDHLGLKVRRRGRILEFFPRSCPHEGADLDGVEPESSALPCPWHGRRLRAAAVFDLDGASGPLTIACHRIEIADGVIQVMSGDLDGAAPSGTQGRASTGQ